MNSPQAISAICAHDGPKVFLSRQGSVACGECEAILDGPECWACKGPCYCDLIYSPPVVSEAASITAFIEARARQYRAAKRQGDAITLEAIASDIRAGLHIDQPETLEAA